jgi:hypothetical protein
MDIIEEQIAIWKGFFAYMPVISYSFRVKKWGRAYGVC